MDRKVNQFIILFSLLFLFLMSSFTWTAAKAASTDNVIDDLDFLTLEELNQIQSEIDQAVLEHNLDIVIVITDNTEAKSSMDFADDYYDYNGYGVGSDASGLLMLINMYDREIWISTTGEAIAIFSDDRIENILDIVTPYLSDVNYYQASMAFISQVKNFAAVGPPSHVTPDDKYSDWEEPYYPGDSSASSNYWQRVLRIMSAPAVYIIGIIAALIGVGIASSGNKGKVTINNRTYEEGGSFQLIDKRDDFINQTVTRALIPKNNSSSGGRSGSSVHRGSSGRSHGGGGRRF
ncbi:MAG: TPM domain-containing protein [Clostridia bacterium]|nr:TPM domain-containing protein [Clostridia bacterium]